MNILILGNGFDLAHGLPTKYTDFLEWVKAEYALYRELKEKNVDIVEKIKEITIDYAIDYQPSKIEVTSLEETIQLQIWKCINKNIWINYFLNNKTYQKENWIDFEREIFDIIKSVDNDTKTQNFFGQIENLSNEFLDDNFLHKGFESLLNDKNGERAGKQQITYQELTNILLEDLNRLIRALEIYLVAYVEKLKYNVVSPDIQNINVDYVLSFNYTNTYEKIYGEGKNIDYDYIHGKGNINNTIETNNMVLGIDEYLSEDRKNNDIEFIAFKKFYQRIHKETGCKYRQWVDIIVEEIKDIEETLRKNFPVQIPFEKFPNKHYLYIFGHSLDITDKDILRDLILNDNVYTTIYYFNKDIYGQQIANLVRVIGQDELIRRTGGNTKTIEFKKQQDMTKKILH